MLPWKRFTDLTITRRLMRPNRKLILPVSGIAAAGATAGWIPGGGTGATDIAEARLPASQTSSTLLVPISGFVQPGDVIKQFYFQGQIESAGNGVTVTTQLKYATAAAADNAATAVGSGSTTGSKTADFLLTPATAGEVFVPGHQVIDDAQYFILVTGTTGASTDVALLSLVLIVDQA